MTRAWPLERGWMSRKARTEEDSKSLREGMSPGGDSQVVERKLESRERRRHLAMYVEILLGAVETSSYL